MSDLHDKIVDYLADPFISQRAVDPTALARILQKSYPTIGLEELTGTISRVANGLGMRVLQV